MNTIEIARAEMKLALPSGGPLMRGSINLFRRADVNLIGTLNGEQIIFDQNTCMVNDRQPTSGAGGRLDVSYFKGRSIAQRILTGQFDLGIVREGTALKFGMENNRITGLTLVDFKSEQVIDAELLSSSFVDEQVLEVERLRGIEGFRDRMLVKVLRASRLMSEEAKKYQQTQALRNAEVSEADFAEVRTFWG